MKRTILLLLAVPVVAYLGIKLHVHAQVGDTMEALIAQAKPVAEISYERITSGIDGRVGVRNVSIRPAGIADQVHIREVSLHLPNLLYLLQLEDRVQRQELPESFSVAVEDVSIPTRGALANAWEDALLEADALAADQAFDNCATRSSLPSEMHRLGYDEIRGRFTFGYYYDPAARSLVLHSQAGQHQAVSFSGELAILVNHFDLQGLAAAFADPEIVRASLELSDAGYFQRVYASCEEQGVSRDEVAALLMADASGPVEGLPMQLDQPLLDAYARFLEGGSSIVFTAEPREPKKLGYLALYDPLDVPAVLNLNATVY